MREAFLQMLVRWGACSRSTTFRVVSVSASALLILIVVPWLLISGLLCISARWHSLIPRGLEWTFGLLSALDGLCLVLWSIFLFWRQGWGTPNPVAPTRMLVVDGPYAYCRHPFQLGVMFYYLGIGTISVSLTAGAVLFLIWLVWTGAYHKCVEEPELLRRFGSAYEEYRGRTPFLFPRFRPNRKKPVGHGRSNSP